MPALLLPLLLAAFQDLPVDDIGPKFQGLPPHRQWEMAEAYFRKIAGRLRAGDYDEARLWDRRARDHVAAGYRARLKELGEGFWTELQRLPANKSQVDFKALQIVQALTVGDKGDLALIRKGAEENKLPPAHVHFHKVNLALARACVQDYPGARAILEELVREKPADAMTRDIETAREQIDRARDSHDPVDLVQALDHLAARSRCSGARFAVLRFTLGLLNEPRKDAVRRSLEDAAIASLKSLGDAEGAADLEAKVRQRTADEKTPLQEQARRAFERKDYEAAETAYGQLIQKFPGNPSVADWLFHRGKSLKFLGKFADARDQFTRVLALAADAPKPGRHFGTSYKVEAGYEIPGCLKGEGKWADALEHWTRLTKVQQPPSDWDDRRRDLEVFEGLQRCRVKLNRNEEAYLAYGKFLSGENPASPAVAAGYVDLALKLGRYEEAERRMAAPGFTKGKEFAREYIFLLKLRQARDARGLFDYACQSPPESNNARSWRDCRTTTGWLGAEAIERLAELGDAAIDFLVPIIQLKVDHDYLALIALARVRTERSRAILDELAGEKSARRERYDQARALSLDPPREGGRLPEKPVPAEPPAAAANKQAEAERIRQRFPELVARVKGIDLHLAAGTAEGRWRALGDTVTAWRKGSIVDEDFGDLVSLALEEKWTFSPQTLLEWVREHRAVPAAPLLIPLLSSGNSEVQGGALQLLGDFRHRPAVPAIAELLDDLHPDISARAAAALVALEARSEIPKIVDRLKAQKVESRKERFIWALGRLMARDRIADIAPYLKSPEAKCRAAAADALGRLEAHAHVEEIRPLLEDPDEGVRMAAKGALKRLEDSKGK